MKETFDEGNVGWRSFDEGTLIEEFLMKETFDEGTHEERNVVDGSFSLSKVESERVPV